MPVCYCGAVEMVEILSTLSMTLTRCGRRCFSSADANVVSEDPA